MVCIVATNTIFVKGACQCSGISAPPIPMATVRPCTISLFFISLTSIHLSIKTCLKPLGTPYEFIMLWKTSLIECHALLVDLFKDAHSFYLQLKHYQTQLCDLSFGQISKEIISILWILDFSNFACSSNIN